MGKIRIGAICNDGFISTSTGRGACSWHGGVKEWLYQQQNPLPKRFQPESSELTQAKSENSQSSFCSLKKKSSNSPRIPYSQSSTFRSWGSSKSIHKRKAKSFFNQQSTQIWVQLILILVKCILFISLLGCTQQLCYKDAQVIRNMSPKFLIYTAEWILSIIPFQRSYFLIMAQLLAVYQFFKIAQYLLREQKKLVIILLVIVFVVIKYNESSTSDNKVFQTISSLRLKFNDVFQNKYSFSQFIEHYLNEYKLVTLSFDILSPILDHFYFYRNYVILSLNVLVYYLLVNQAIYMISRLVEQCRKFIKIIAIFWILMVLIYAVFYFTPHGVLFHTSTVKQSEISMVDNQSLSLNQSIIKVNQQQLTLQIIDQQPNIQNPQQIIQQKIQIEINQNQKLSEVQEKKQQNGVKDKSLSDLQDNPQINYTSISTDQLSQSKQNSEVQNKQLNNSKVQLQFNSNLFNF